MLLAINSDISVASVLGIPLEHSATEIATYLPIFYTVKLHQVTQNESRNLLFIAKIEVSILPFTQVT